jgi:hypothetical protein
MVSEKHWFDTENAKQYGIVEAILIENLSFWIGKNMANKTHIHKVVEGELAGQERCWSYNSVVAFTKIFDYISPKKIRTSLDGLVEKKVLLKGNFSKDKTDRSNWYAFYCEEDFISGKYISIKESHLPHRANALAPQGECIYTDKKQTDKKHIPAEENKDNISLLTSNTTMYESKKTNIELNCTLPINDVIIPIVEKKPKKEVKDPAIMSENRRFSKDFTEAWSKAGKEKLTQIGYVAINKLFTKHGYEKGMFFCDYLCQMYGSNEKSIAKIENQDKALLFYQDPQEEQPKYLGITKWDSYKRFKNEQEEPSMGSFFNEDSFYAALEYFYSNQFGGTELVKKVRERVKEINCKYNKY